MIEISELSLEEILEFSRKHDREGALAIGGSIHGFVDAVCRDVDSGDPVWEIHQPNIFTDYGRMLWYNDTISLSSTLGIFTSDFAEIPRADRFTGINYRSGPGGSTYYQWQGAISPSVDWGTASKYTSYTFGTPSVNRPIACVGMAWSGATSFAWAFTNIICYSLISPTKVQTTTQTLEISYRLSMSMSV